MLFFSVLATNGQIPSVIVESDTTYADTIIRVYDYRSPTGSTNFGPWAEIGGYLRADLRAGIGLHHSATASAGWVTAGGGVGVNYLREVNWWGVSATGWYNPYFLNLAADLGAYRSWENSVWYFRPRIGIRFYFMAVDYGYSLADAAARPHIERHTIRLQINYLKL
ncbi:MAG: hypothetical protein ACFB10_06065 [Salibacteraceae bacterium]